MLPCHPALPLASVTLDVGMKSLMILTATLSCRLGQVSFWTPLQTKGALVAGSVGLVAEAVKLPVRSRAVGTRAPLRKVLVAWRSPEYEAKKNALSFLIGPPRVAPNWLRWKGALARVDPQSLALKTVLRRNSKTEP